jgi:hypothetical protein
LALPLVDPVVTQEVGLFWAEGEIVMPLANAFVSIIQKLNKSGELRKRLAGDQAPMIEAETVRKLAPEMVPVRGSGQRRASAVTPRAR